jgi:surface protein
MYGWPMNSWCVSNVDEMTQLSIGQATFNENISGWNVSSVTDMSYMFYGATDFNCNLSDWDVQFSH